MRSAIIMIGTKNYAYPVRKAIEAFRANNRPIDIVMISEDMEAQDLPEGVIIHRPNVKAYEGIPKPPSWPRLVYYRFDSLLTGYDKVTFLDADELVLEDVSEIIYSEHPVSAIMELTHNDLPPMFNIGMFSIMPDKFPGLFDRLISLSKTRYRLNEMSVLNEWVKRDNIDIFYHDQSCDVIKRAYVYKKKWWNLNKDKIKVLHYVGSPKPWDGDEWQYEALHEFWREYKPGNQLPEAV